MRDVRIHIATLFVASVATPVSGSPRETVRLSANQDSSGCVTCIDVRTGAAFATPAAVVGDSGREVASAASLSRLCVGSLSAVHSVVTSDGSGGAFVAWTGNSGETCDLRLTRVDAGGATPPEWPASGRAVCEARGSRSQPAMVRGADGGVWSAWVEHRAGERAHVRVSRFSPDGSLGAGWPVDGRRATTTDRPQSLPRLVTASDGRVWLLWQEGRAGARDIRALVHEPEGAPAAGWPDTGRVVGGGGADRFLPVVVADAADGVVLASHERDGEASVVKLQRLDAEGAGLAAWPEVTLAGGGEVRLGSLIADSAAVHAAWTSGPEDSVVARVLRLTRSGEVAAGWPGPGLVLGGGAGEEPVLRPDGAGGVYAAWTRTGARGDGAVALTRLGAAGEVAAGWPSAGVELPDAEGDEHGPRLAAAEGGVLVSWSRGQGAPGGTVLRSGGTLGETLPELRTVSSWPDLVRLEWSLAGAVPYTVSVERRDGGGEWRRVSELTMDAEGRLSLEDRELVPGARLAYRLRLATPALEATMPEVDVSVPLAAPLALQRIVLEGGRLRAWFSLPTRDEARLEVFDVQGRRVFRQAVRVEHAGESEGEWPTPVLLRSGIWFARLTQGRERRGLRVVLPR